LTAPFLYTELLTEIVSHSVIQSFWSDEARFGCAGCYRVLSIQHGHVYNRLKADSLYQFEYLVEAFFYPFLFTQQDLVVYQAERLVLLVSDHQPLAALPEHQAGNLRQTGQGER
jgi:hypothetical protein